MRASRVLLALVALVAIAGTWWLLRAEPATRGGFATPEAPRAARKPQTDVASLEAPQAAEMRAAPAAPGARSAAAVSASGEQRALDVFVLLPDGLPFDESLTVVAAPAERMGADAPLEFLQRLRNEGDPSGVVRASVDSEGHARLHWPVEVGVAQLVLDGRFLFLREPVVVDASLERIELSPTVGAAVDVRLVAQTDQLLSGSMQLSGGDWSGGRGSWRQLEQPVGAELLEFRGLDPRLTWTVSPSIDEHHAEMEMALETVAGEALLVEVAVTQGAAVRGEVVDSNGAPLAGVRVAASNPMPWMGAPERSVLTTSDGRFALRGLPPGATELEAELDGWRGATSAELSLTDGSEQSGVRLVLDRGLTITGSVRNSDGGPGSGAEVVVEQLRSRNWGGWGGSQVDQQGSATSDDEGHFTVGGLEEGRFTVRASRENDGQVARAVLEGVEAGGAPVVLDLLAPVAFTGRVIDDLEQPVTAFEVELASIDEGGPTERKAFEGPAGRFRFASAGPGEWQVRVLADGYTHPDSVLHALPDSGTELVLQVQRTARLAGRVTDTTGLTVADATVLGDDGRETAFGGWGRSGPSVETEAEGRFVMEDVAPGTLVLTARADAWADSEPLALELAPGEQREDIVLALRVGGRIEGQVVTPEGDPLANKRVTWGDNAMGFGSRGETTSNSSGHFAFDHVTPGEWAVSAIPSMEEFRDGMRAGGQSAWVDVMGDLVTKTVVVEDGELVEVFLGGEPRYPVRVFGTVSRAGEPLAQAEVYAVSESSAVFEGMKAARSSGDGSYELVIDRPGPHTISASLGNVGVEVVVDIPRQDEIQVDLRIPLGRIEGRVRQPDGTPATGIQLGLERNDGLGRIRWSGGQQTSDDTGSYAFEDLEPGRYTVRANVQTWGASADDRFGAAVQGDVVVDEDRSTSNVDLQLEAAGSVRGVVRASNGEPLGGASLYFRDAAGRLVTRFSTTLSDPAGRFEKRGLAPGDYTISARSEGETAGDTTRVRVASGQAAEVQVQLETGVHVVVRLEDPDGQARRSRVEVLDSTGNDVGGLITTDAMRAAFNEGAATMEQRLGPLPPGRYTVRATTADGKVEERRVRLRAGDEDKRVVLKLE